jgi:protein-S-isoprenylcysteine O-methyltransferase Ste14
VTRSTGIIVGLLCGLAGAALIVLYTFANRRARGTGAGAHYWSGWGLAAPGMLLMGAGWLFLALAGPHLGLRILSVAGGALCAAAAAVYVASARWVGRFRRPSHYSLALETAGIYARVRHPQALSLCLLAAGVGLASGSLPSLVTAPLWIAFWTAYTFLEEKNELLPAFGEDYRRYAKRTPRLIPRLRSAPRKRE